MPSDLIILIGFSTTGKSVVAGEVARRLGWRHVDTDDVIIELAGEPISEIFAQEGEEHFRELERQVLREVCQRNEAVIAAGGGAILDAGNRQLMAKSGTVVCLEATVGTIYQRLLADTATSGPLRPLLAVKNPIERIKQLKEFRQPYYAAADWTVHTDNLTIAEVATEVIRGWQYCRRRQQRDVMPLKGKDPACEVRTATEHCPVFVNWGILDELGKRMRGAGLKGVAHIISDETVFSIYGSRVRKVLEDAGFAVNAFILPSGETTKTLDSASKIYDFLLEHKVERNDIVVALGGGVVGDLAGFVAATLLRGLPLVQVPTSLVAMVDASIGGKVAVNHPRGKNLIGAFYQPCLVLADVQTLTTLPRRELASGWAEVIKHGLILDAELFAFLEENVSALVGLMPEVTVWAIARSAAVKAGIVSEDEKEGGGSRTLLNYGHTIAHGLEAATGYECFLHGEAVAIGMMGAAMLSQRLGLVSPEVVERQRDVLERFDLPTTCPGIDMAAVLRAMELDKKVRERTIHWVLLRGVGEAVVQAEASQEDVRAVLAELGMSGRPG